MNEYHTLMVRMVFDFVNKNSTKVNFELLLWYWNPIGANNHVTIIRGSEHLDEVGLSLKCFYCLLCGNNQVLLNKSISHFVDTNILENINVLYSFKCLVDSFQDLYIM
jgi:hypothetical protein